MPQTQVEYLMADADGQPASTSVFVDGLESDVGAGDTLAIQSAIIGLCAAEIYAVVNHAFNSTPVGEATANDYGSPDKLKVYGRSANGQDVEMSIPAPLEAIFNADKETVDITAGAGLTLKDALEDVWVGPDGSAVTVLSMERARPTRLGS